MQIVSPSWASADLLYPPADSKTWPCQLRSLRLPSGGTPWRRSTMGAYYGKHSIYMPTLDQPRLPQTCVGSSLSSGYFEEELARLHGISLKLPEGGSISWRRPDNAEGAFVRPRTTKNVEIRGVPFGYRKWRQLKVILQPVGDLCKIICTGLDSGDPNCLCVDVEMEVDKEVPQKLLAKMGMGALRELWLAVLPPPPAIPMLPTGPQSAESLAHTAALAQASLGGEQLSHKQPARGISPNQSRRRSETAPVPPPPPPQAISYNPETATEATPRREPDTSKTMAREGETLGDGPRDSLLMYRSRRARRDTTMTSGECQSYLAMTEERQGVTGQAIT